MIPSLLRFYKTRSLLKVSEKMVENRRMKIYYKSGAMKVRTRRKPKENTLEERK